MSRLSKFVEALIERRPILAGILRNFSWQTFDRVFRMGLGVFVVVLVTRYLGPARFGSLSYALAFAGMFTPLAGLGLDGIVVRELAREGRLKDAILGSAFSAKLGGGLACFLIIMAVAAATAPHDPTLLMMTGIFGSGLLFYSMDVVDYWFQSQMRMKYVALPRALAFLAASLLKIGVIVAGGSLFHLALATVAETVLAAAGLGIAYRLAGQRIWRWRPDGRLVKRLLAESWPLIISGFAVLVYMRIDQVMLGILLDDRAVGLYATAVKFSEIWYFIPGAVSISVFPVMVGYFRTDRALFFQKYQNILNTLAGGSIALALIMTFLSTRLVKAAFGPEFIEAGPVLAIHIWAGVFVFIGFGGSIWTLINGYQKFTLFASLAGLLTKIALNLAVIPSRGILGAAASMVIAQGVASYLVYFPLPKTRRIFWMMTRAFIAPWRFSRAPHPE